MKQAWQRLVANADTQERTQFLSAVVMITIFLAFWGVSFWVLINSFA